MAFKRLEEHWRHIKKSLLLLIPSIRNEAYYFQTHIALNLASHGRGRSEKALIKVAKKGIRSMKKGGGPWPTTLAHLLEAELVLLMGREQEAIASFKEVIGKLDDLKMHLHAFALRFKLGELIKGDEGALLVDEAQGFFDGQSIKNPHALTRMLLP